MPTEVEFINTQADVTVIEAVEVEVGIIANEVLYTNVTAEIGTVTEVAHDPFMIVPAGGASATLWPAASQAAMLALTTATKGDLALRSDTSETFFLTANPPGTLANWSRIGGNGSRAYAVTDQADMLSQNNARRGDIAIRTDNTSTYMLLNDTPGTLGNWLKIAVTVGGSGGVSSVDGRTGTVTLSDLYAPIASAGGATTPAVKIVPITGRHLDVQIQQTDNALMAGNCICSYQYAGEWYQVRVFVGWTGTSGNESVNRHCYITKRKYPDGAWETPVDLAVVLGGGTLPSQPFVMQYGDPYRTGTNDGGTVLGSTTITSAVFTGAAGDVGALVTGSTALPPVARIVSSSSGSAVIDFPCTATLNTQTFTVSPGSATHSALSVGVSKDGHIHVMGNVHNDPINYARTVAANNDIQTPSNWQNKTPTSTALVSGNLTAEQSASYPKFVRQGTGSDDLFMTFRDTNGSMTTNWSKWWLYRWNTATPGWENALGSVPLVDGNTLFQANRTVAGCTLVLNSNILTSTNTFTTADVGCYLSGNANLGSGHYITNIVDANHAQMSLVSAATVGTSFTATLTPKRGPYLNHPIPDANGDIHVFWLNKYATVAVTTYENDDVRYLMIKRNGTAVSVKNSDGTTTPTLLAGTVPADGGEVVLDTPNGTDTGLIGWHATVDYLNRPHVLFHYGQDGVTAQAKHYYRNAGNTAWVPNDLTQAMSSLWNTTQQIAPYGIGNRVYAIQNRNGLRAIDITPPSTNANYGLVSFPILDYKFNVWLHGYDQPALQQLGILAIGTNDIVGMAGTSAAYHTAENVHQKLNAVVYYDANQFTQLAQRSIAVPTIRSVQSESYPRFDAEITGTVSAASDWRGCQASTVLQGDGAYYYCQFAVEGRVSAVGTKLVVELWEEDASTPRAKLIIIDSTTNTLRATGWQPCTRLNGVSNTGGLEVRAYVIGAGTGFIDAGKVTTQLGVLDEQLSGKGL